MTDYEELDARLRAWLAEDEAAANAAIHRGGDKWVAEWDPGALAWDDRKGPSSGVGHVADQTGRFVSFGSPTDGQSNHIARHDPAAVLADIAGKRALLDHVAGWLHTLVDGDWWFSCSQAVLDDGEPGSGCADEKRKGKPCDCGLDDRRLAVLRCVAAGYVERPEFKPAWRING